MVVLLPLPKVPSDVQKRLKSRGPKLKNIALKRRALHLKEVHGCQYGGCPTAVRQIIGTDCSGLDAPIMAMERLQIQHKHVFSSEKNAKAFEWIKANFEPVHLFDDALKRPEVGGLTGYVSGWPCQPFSRLNSSSKVWKDARVKPLLRGLGTLKVSKPCWAVFENVKGLLRHIAGFKQRLTTRKVLDDYMVFMVPMCPRFLFNEPARRPRLYFLMIRKDVAVLDHVGMIDMLSAILKDVLAEKPPALPWRSYWMAPSPDFPDFNQSALMSVKKPSSGGKRVDRHVQEKRALSAVHWTRSLRIPTEGLSDREGGAFKIEYAKMKCPDVFVGDVSQNAGRMPVGRDGEFPTLTTSCKPIVYEKGMRLLKLLGSI